MSSVNRLLLAALIVLLNGWLTQQSPVAQNYSSEILRLAKAAQVKAYLLEEKEPCENFYKFACGKWKRLHPAKESSVKTSYLEQLQELYVGKSVEMLKGDRKSDNSVDLMLKDFYESCRNKNALQQIGIQPILKVVDLKGGWPTVTSHSWYESEYDWLKVVAELRRKLGVDILVGLDVVPDFEDKDMHRIMVGAPRLDLSLRDHYLSDKFGSKREEYKENIAHKLNKYFPDMPEEWSQEVAGQVLALEQELAKGLPENPNLSLKQTTRQRYAAELKSAYGNYVDLSRYLNLIFNQTIYVQVYETPEDYMSNLVEVIKQTPKLTIANYTMWRVLELFDYASEIARKQNDNWCVHKVMEYFPHQLESMFHRNYNNMQMINELRSVWADIKKAFREELQTSTKLNWITFDIRQKAVFKLDAMELNVITHDNDYFEEQMHDLQLHKERYYQNLINIMQRQTQHKLAKLIEKPRPAENEIKLPKYQLTTNKIVIPITFLQSRFFWDAAYPNALKYSTLGFILAQEMLHGFDAVGRKYDNHGYQRNWWDTVSEYAYEDRAACFARQYGNYTFQGKEVDDPNALTTSIADNGGLGIAYRAYQKWWQNAADNDLETTKETLPLMDYTRNQIFFIGFAQLWCSNYHQSVQKFTELPERLRVIGALANFNEFAAEFKCPMGGKMNPEKKCSIY